MRKFNRCFDGDDKQEEKRFNTPRKLTEHQKSMQEEDRRLAEKCAIKVGVELKGFETNDILELYFTVFRGEESICYISKGWGDPGFRLGEYLEIDKNIPDFKNKFYKMLKICTKNIIAVDVSTPKPGKVGLNLQIGLYQNGFNDEVLYEALDSLEESLQKIRQLL